MIRKVLFLLPIAALALPVAAADDLAGTTWLRDSGNARIQFAPCGNALCGSVVWLKDTNGPGELGTRIFYDMKPAGANVWEGKAFNPEDGKTYSGKMTLAGATLTTSGCVFGGLLCKSVKWSRVN